MSDVSAQTTAGFAPHRATVSLAGSFMLMLGIFLSGFVIHEPAPYDIFMAVLIGMWSVFGLRISRRVMILAALVVLFLVGGIFSITTMADLAKAPLYMAVSGFLGLSAVFIAAVVEDRASRLQLIYAGYVAGAVVTALLGITGYFGLVPHGEIFTRYGRAMGAFQDPNVFGPYLVLPAVYLVHGILTRRLHLAGPRLAALLVLTLGVFLSFSRAAWALLAFSVALLIVLMLIKERSGTFRLRILLLSIVAILAIAGGLLLALQIPQVAHLFQARAHLEQSYDVAEFGRFERHRLGFALALSRPLGIGPERFGAMFGEDPHNIWLKTLMAYGWLGFVTYLTMIVMTLGFGFRLLLRDRPWHPYLVTAYVVFLGHVLIGDVIDTDHWRHFYLLLGIIWGCSALEVRHQRETRMRMPAGRPAQASS